MKTGCIATLLVCLSLAVNGQSIYNVTFNNGSLPAGWAANDGRVMVVNNVPSSGYTSSPTSPEASGLYNVIFQHCAPPSSTITLTVANVISTVGQTNIRVGFGRRSTNAWDRPVLLEWSSNGNTWEVVDSDISAGASTDWGSVYYDLLSDADNVANLRFRFSYTTTTSQNCTAPPNFRIDDFTVGSSFSLPIELGRFEVQKMGGQVYLFWTTLTELNNDHFVLEHSLDGKTFEQLGQIAGGGTTQLARQYDFWHRNPKPGINYYRLKQVDQGGQISYSALRSVLLEESGIFRIFPSPTADLLYLDWQQGAEQGLNWAIYNTLGNLVKFGNTDVLSPSATAIPVGDLPQGRYVLHITQEQNQSVHQFIKL